MYPPMVFIHTWDLPMVLAHGIHLWYCISKKAINNKPHVVKGQIVRHNVASTVILCFNKTSFFVVLFSLCYLFFSGILILQILSDPFQIFRSWGSSRMENGINPWYSSTHVIHPPMEFTHGIVNGINPWYSSTHDIYSPMVFIHTWDLPMVL